MYISHFKYLCFFLIVVCTGQKRLKDSQGGGGSSKKQKRSHKTSVVNNKKKSKTSKYSSFTQIGRYRIVDSCLNDWGGGGIYITQDYDHQETCTSVEVMKLFNLSVGSCAFADPDPVVN